MKLQALLMNNKKRFESLTKKYIGGTDHKETFLFLFILCIMKFAIKRFNFCALSQKLSGFY